MSYRPITDSWILTRPKVKYYGAYPAGFLHRARHLLGVGDEQAVLHVCGGMVRQYPYRGFGKFDKTLDLNPKCEPDFLRDAREPFPMRQLGNDRAPDVVAYWHAVLIDRPYTPEDAAHYDVGADVLPTANQLIKNAIAVLPPGGRVGMLDYQWPQPPKNAREVAVIAVYCGRNGRARVFTVFERTQ